MLLSLSKAEHSLTLAGGPRVKALSLAAESTMDSKVRFEGIGPFHLPVAQDASATGHLNNGVTVTFLLDTGGSGKELSAVNIQINADVVLKLCSNLLRAIDEAAG
jgi:hypothetical protein